jgi:chromosomal replication initiator protein DnaA
MFGRRSASNPGSGAESLPQPEARTTPTTLRTDPAPPVHRHLGELLIDEGLIKPTQLAEALEIQKAEGGFLGQILVRKGFTTQEAVALCLVKQCKIPHLNLLDYDIGSEQLKLIPQEICRKYHLLPIDKLGRILTVAMVDPLDLEALDAVRKACPDLRIKPILCNWQHYELVSAKLWGGTAGKDSGQHEVTAESLGLGKLPGAAGTAAPAATPPAPAPMESSGITGGDPFNQSAVIRAMQTAQQKQSVVSATAGLSAREVAEAVREAMRELVGALAAQPAARSAPLDPQALTDSIRAAMQEAMTAHLQKAPPAPLPQSSGPSPEQLAALIRDSVNGAMQETLSQLVKQLKGQAGGPAIDPAQLAAAVREGVRESVAEAQRIQNEHGARLAEIAEATLQSVQHTSQLLEAKAANPATESIEPPRRPGLQPSIAPFSAAPGKNAATNADAQREADRLLQESLETGQPNALYTFDNFLPGKANAFTFKLAQAVAAEPGGQYNPFFLYGPVGLGKTHLINAIGNAIAASKPGARIGYVSASLFSQRLGEALREHAVDVFREAYCHWEVLILDDIQFLGGKVEAQEEFFHIFNVLHAAGRQIIIACDKAPDRLGLLESRLVSRFSSGIVAELKAPEWETRMDILRRQCKAQGLKVGDEILSVVAMRVPADIRKMCGSLLKITAYARLVGQDLSPEMAQEILSHLGAEAAA